MEVFVKMGDKAVFKFSEKCVRLCRKMLEGDEGRIVLNTIFHTDPRVKRKKVAFLELLQVIIEGRFNGALRSNNQVVVNMTAQLKNDRDILEHLV